MRDAVASMHLHSTQDIHKIELVNELTGKGDPGAHALTAHRRRQASPIGTVRRL